MSYTERTESRGMLVTGHSQIKPNNLTTLEVHWLVWNIGKTSNSNRWSSVSFSFTIQILRWYTQFSDTHTHTCWTMLLCHSFHGSTCPNSSRPALPRPYPEGPQKPRSAMIIKRCDDPNECAEIYIENIGPNHPKSRNSGICLGLLLRTIINDHYI